MSAKWIRSKQWDDEHIPGWAWPLKTLLRTFSSIWLAVVLLSLVVVYAILASVPAGLIVLGLTHFVYGVTLTACVVGGAALGVLVLRRVWPAGRGGALRFVAMLVLAVVLGAVGAELWRVLAWPRLMYDPGHGT